MDSRESMEFDVVIVGAGPAGLASAIRLKQRDPGISVCVVEKGSEIGAHILSGAVIDPSGLDALLPDWRTRAPLKTEVADDQFYYFTEKRRVRLPHVIFPTFMSNRGNFVGSLGGLCKFLGEEAERLGVDLFPGFAAADFIVGRNGEVQGIVTGDLGIGKDGRKKDSYQPGVALRAKYTLLAEGARGFLSAKAMDRFELCAGRAPQKYGIGLKELWEVPSEKHRPGFVMHTLGWPLDDETGGGGFVYQYGENLVSVGFVVHLDYKNPHLSPFEEFQRFKTHPSLRLLLDGGRRIAYGARAITEGGFQSVPKLSFPGGALIGCTAGFMDVPRIKGSHNAIKTGIMAADAVGDALNAGRSGDTLDDYEEAYLSSGVRRDLMRARNLKPLWSRFGTIVGVTLGGFDMWLQTLLGFGLFGTLSHQGPDHASLEAASKRKPVAYPRPDGRLSFDRLSSVFLSGTHHGEDEPAHLKLKYPEAPVRDTLPLYAEPAQRYCPAGVFEIVRDPEPRFVINAANCIHCKTCEIKDPAQTILWTPPEGGDGPIYGNM